MDLLAPSLIAASAAIIVALGLVHLLYTFRGNKFAPRDAALEARLKEVSPVITRQTTMWRSMIGFHASHSLGAILFGVMYAYLACVQTALLFQSTFLLLLGLAFLLAVVTLARLYWFSIPFRGISLAAALYAAALAVHWA